MNEMEVFRFEGSQVRTVFNEGQMWWVAKDVCEVLGLKKPENSYSKIDIEDRAVTLIEKVTTLFLQEQSQSRTFAKNTSSE
jgi:anti-repressor protein